MEKINKRFFTLPNDSCFIFGPRGTGKSTWIKRNLPHAFIINLLNDAECLQYLANPGHIREVVNGNKHDHSIFVVDEIQKIPQRKFKLKA